MRNTGIDEKIRYWKIRYWNTVTGGEIFQKYLFGKRRREKNETQKYK
jgi:hypothetical protein